jgi:glycosylphosphatidylinositol transamidase (GPIT) subunit GPI8
MSREVMRKFAPQVLVVVFSDVEVAHFGSYAMHMGGIRTVDRLAYQLWQEVEANPEYKGKTTMAILPEFGRDPRRLIDQRILQSPRQLGFNP